MTLPEAPVSHIAFASLHVLVGHFLSAWIHRWRFRQNPLVLHHAPDSPHRRVSRIVGAISTIWAVALVGSALSEQFRSSMVGIPFFVFPKWLADSLAVAGLMLMTAAQISMGRAFRVGQDERKPPEALCETGLHRFSRNPIYVGSWTCLLGMTLWWPGAILVISCLAIGLGIHQLVLQEETFLAQRFPEEFRAYCQRIPRYVGFVQSGSRS